MRARTLATMNGRRGFTLVELMVVTAIVALLSGLLMPMINVASEASKRTQCAAQLREVGQAVLMYAQDNKAYLPAGACPSETYISRIWDLKFKCNSGLLVDPYLQNRIEVLYCPTTVKNDLPRAKQYFGVKNFDVSVPYQHRLISQGAYAKVGQGKRQAIMFDLYTWSNKPSQAAFINVSHKGGVNCLFSDGSVIWEAVPQIWNGGNAAKAWPQLDTERFVSMF